MNSRSQILKWRFGSLLASVISLGADTLPDKVESIAAVDDVERPAVVSVEVPANGSYRAGVVLPFTLNLSENVLVDATGGTPSMALKVGGDTISASYASGTGTNTLIFNYTVQAGNNDTDGIELPAYLSPNGGSIRDAAGNDLIGVLNGAASTTGVFVDTIAPVATGIVRLDSNPTNAASVRFSITFSEPVTGLNSGDFATATMGEGMGGGLVWVSKITETSPAIFDLVVSGLKGTGIMHIILLSYATVYDVAGNRITTNKQSPNYNVDRIAPMVNSVVVPANATYRTGQNLDLSVNFSEPITPNTLGGTPRIPITLDTGGTVFAYLRPGSGTSALTFRLTISAGQLDGNGITVGSSIDLNGGALRDAVGNDLTTALNGMGSTGGVLVDGVAPLAVSLKHADPSPTNASSVRYTLTFSEPVKGVDINDFEMVSFGMPLGTRTSVDSVDSKTYTLLITGLTGDGSFTVFLKTSGSGIVDLAGNSLANSASGPWYLVDRVSPVVTSLAIPAEATYLAGQSLDFTVAFDETVTVDTMGGMPRIAIAMEDGGPAFADYLSGSGSRALVFRMIVANGQADINGVTLASTIDLAGGAIRDALGNAINPALNSVASTTGVRVDAIPPTVAGSGIPNQTLTIGNPAKVVSLLPCFTDIGSTSMTYSVTANSTATKASAIISGSNLTLSPLANGVTNLTIQADDGHGGTVSDTFEVAVGTTTPTPLRIGTTGTLNRQNGLFELTVKVTNTTPRPLNGFRLKVDCSAYQADYPSLRLYNASSPAGSLKVHVDYPFPVAVNSVVSMKLWFYTNTRTFPSLFKPKLSVEVLTTSQVTDTDGEGVQPRIAALANKNILIEFPSVVGRWDRVRYSNDAIRWQDCPVPIQAGTSRMQWIDSGPPFTDVPPAQARSRFYRVNEITAPRTSSGNHHFLRFPIFHCDRWSRQPPELRQRFGHHGASRRLSGPERNLQDQRFMGDPGSRTIPVHGRLRCGGQRL
jgi:hypothetical protein